MAALGFIIAGVPGVVMLSFAVCVLSVVPVGPPLVWGAVAIWQVATDQVGWAVFMVLWGTLAVSSVDNFIKPILISRGTALPLALVFLGVLGGIMSFGMLGVVLGPIFLAASIAMVRTWLRHPVKRFPSIAGQEKVAGPDETGTDGQTDPETKPEDASAPAPAAPQPADTPPSDGKAR